MSIFLCACFDSVTPSHPNEKLCVPGFQIFARTWPFGLFSKLLGLLLRRFGCRQAGYSASAAPLARGLAGWNQAVPSHVRTRAQRFVPETVKLQYQSVLRNETGRLAGIAPQVCLGVHPAGQATQKATPHTPFNEGIKSKLHSGSLK